MNTETEDTLPSPYRIWREANKAEIKDLFDYIHKDEQLRFERLFCECHHAGTRSGISQTLSTYRQVMIGGEEE